ncbi:MAG: glutamate--tRNA ligase [Candidatus Woesearchaeota archaeon]|jgi:glutamyl-tRNA synthetase|nr:glutamate--tRNA ligase [Candidatus Woesearchaeota archaeon]
MKQLILKYALQNAVKFNGKANPGAIIGKVLSENPDLKSKAKEVNKDIMQIVKEVNSLPLDKQKEKLKDLAPDLLKKQKKVEKKKELPTFKEKKVVMRFEPSPSGPLHIGHAFTLSLNSELARKHKGKLIIRIADTNPENIYEKAYKLIPIDAEWITKNNVNDIIIQSDRLKLYYKYAEELIKKEHAYVCTCKAEDFRESMLKSIPCPCRHIRKQANVERWEKMLTTFKEGDAVVRIKTDITHKNPAMRDWPALRINLNSHPKQKTKYRVWPLMNFAVTIDDHELGITHAIRAKEHMDNEKRQKYLYDYLGWKMPEHLYIGRINFKDLRVSCSKTRPLIEDGTYTGWDDIRLPFLEALKRRGYHPDAFIKYALDVGISQTDKTTTGEEFFKAINAFNKDAIDSKSHRYFFIESPVEIKVSNAPMQNVELDLHPNNRKKGRKFSTTDKFYLTKEDHKNIKDNKLIRLMDCLNFKKEGKEFTFDSLDYNKFKEQGNLIIHWLPKEKDLVNVEVIMPDNKIKKGLGERGLKDLSEGQVIQFERFGFVRLDQKLGNKLVFWFAHK